MKSTYIYTINNQTTQVSKAKLHLKASYMTINHGKNLDVLTNTHLYQDPSTLKRLVTQQQPRSVHCHLTLTLTSYTCRLDATTDANGRYLTPFSLSHAALLLSITNACSSFLSVPRLLWLPLSSRKPIEPEVEETERGARAHSKRKKEKLCILRMNKTSDLAERKSKSVHLCIENAKDSAFFSIFTHKSVTSEGKWRPRPACTRKTRHTRADTQRELRESRKKSNKKVRIPNGEPGLSFSFSSRLHHD